jgi:hypothetical protein
MFTVDVCRKCLKLDVRMAWAGTPPLLKLITTQRGVPIKLCAPCHDAMSFGELAALLEDRDWLNCVRVVFTVTPVSLEAGETVEVVFAQPRSPAPVPAAKGRRRS